MLSQEGSELSSSAVLPIGKFESIYSSRLDIQRRVLKNEDEAYMHAFEALMNQVSDVRLSAKEISIVQVKAEHRGYLIFITDARSVLGALPIL
ncbi:hypothetical protein HC752_04910 [Vibrio sp. S9_S30]|uniref:hypothetical protein n=1 Tax=Vibrio sp. S9_S30 TaxID=2720226 RepID=UPI00167FE388|nr:hypothetical protein [Vibrio sp. S9_S30]MBD1556270.1 hypothetical protein [Vibrio sp. S9_S30]